MTRVIVLGAGVMGTAFTLPMSDNGMSVHLVGTHLDRELVAVMRDGGFHPRLRAPIGGNVRVFQDTEMAAAFTEPADVIVVGVSTPGVDWAIGRLAEYMRATPPILMLTKGISTTPDRIEILPDYCARELDRLGKQHGQIGGVGGPCIAGELAVRRQTASLVGFRDVALAKHWAAALTAPYYQLRSTDDLIGLEVCAALKNFYAIGVSVPAGEATHSIAVNGAGLNNPTASLFNQAIYELQLLAALTGGHAQTATGLAGLGDLHVTCQAGRNSRLGRLLGTGMTYREAMDGPLVGETVEGTLVAEALRQPLLSNERQGALRRRDIPLAWAIIVAVTQNKPLDLDWASLHGAGEVASVAAD